MSTTLSCTQVWACPGRTSSPRWVSQANDLVCSLPLQRQISSGCKNLVSVLAASRFTTCAKDLAQSLSQLHERITLGLTSPAIFLVSLWIDSYELKSAEGVLSESGNPKG